MKWTQQQIDAYEARRARHSVDSLTNHPSKDEGTLHCQIIDECARRSWVPLHGSMAHRTYRTPGEPDFIILAERGRVLMVECKTGIGKLSIDQLALQMRAEKLGHKIHVVRSFSEFLQVINHG